MAKFHINPLNGNVSSCAASVGLCPFGGEREHYEDVLSAREAYESAMGAPPLKGLRNRQDIFTQKTFDTLKKLEASAKTEREKGIYNEILVNYEDAGVTELHRLAQTASAKAEIAYEFDRSEDAQTYFNIYLTIAVAEDSRGLGRTLQYSLDRVTIRGLESNVAEFKEDILKNYKKLDEKLSKIAAGKEPFDIWELAEINEPARSYRLKEIPSTHPKIREILSSSDQVLLGKVTKQEYDSALREMEDTGQALLAHLETVYGKEVPSGEYSDSNPPGPLEGAPGFELVGAGSEVNVYLHRESMMVYKVRHRENLYGFQDGPTNDYGRTAVVKLQKLYENHNLKGLQAINASYVKTYFLAPKDSDGKAAAMVVQPYLDPKKYGPYDPTLDEESYLRDLGFNDSHSGNMSIDLTTGSLVLFDCINAS